MAMQPACTDEHDAQDAHTHIGALLRHPAIWRARDRQDRPADGHPSGHPLLDAQLPARGWPRSGLVELLINRPGIGELQLLMPLLARLSAEDARWIAWIHPPFTPYAPALTHQRVQLEKLLWVRTRDDRETLWATHQSLDSGSCSLVLGWSDKDILASESRRLQVSASDGDTLCILFRPLAAGRQASSAALRLALRACPEGLRVETLKCRGSWPAQPVAVTLPDAPGFQPERVTPPLPFPLPVRGNTSGAQQELFARTREKTRHVPSLPETPTPLPVAGNPSPGSSPRSRAFL